MESSITFVDDLDREFQVYYHIHGNDFKNLMSGGLDRHLGDNENIQILGAEMTLGDNSKVLDPEELEEFFNENELINKILEINNNTLDY